MSKDINLATDKFLEAAARKLVLSSPAVSAHIQLSRGGVKTTKIKSQFQNGICQRCGTIQVPGKTSEAKIDRPVTSMKKSERRLYAGKPCDWYTRHGVKRGKRLLLSCLACYANEITSLEWTHNDKRGENAANALRTESKASEASGGGTSSVPRSTNQSSKARAKARRGGLQAMAVRAKPAGGAPGLDLMDLMMEGGP